MIPDWGRRLAIVTAAVFFVSLVFPVAAGLSHNTATFPKWWGALDVSVALVLAALALVILGFSQGKVSKQAEDVTYRAYRILIHGVFAMLVAFFLFGSRIVWSNCLTGLAWRTWLLLYALPAWFTAMMITGDG
jgi:uncharacterized protein YhhL (DUF1145 family)